jgi:hypothetical protein
MVNDQRSIGVAAAESSPRPRTLLGRQSGPSGAAVVNGQHVRIEGWELFVGDPASPNNGRGWFKCTQAAFRAPRNSMVHLDLVDEDPAITRSIDVRIVHVKSTEPLWEFMVEDESYSGQMLQ